MLLTSKFEMWLGWGPDLNFFYNDAYIPTLGAKHPHMLGQPFETVWSEVYADVADQVDRVWRGEATWNNALLLLLERNGYPEETYHSFSYSPLHGADGAVGGLLCVVSEDTERVIADRRLEILRRLGQELVGAADERAIRDAVCRVFRDYRRDFPFVLFLPAGPETAGWACAPDSEGLLDRPWPLPDGDGISTVALAADEAWPSGGWDSSPVEAMAVGAPGVGDSGPAGVFVAGLNPHRREDPDIAGFGRLVANQIGAALANASALSRERNRADQLWARSRDRRGVVDADGVFRAVNPAWTRILGHEADAVVGRSFDAFMAPEDIADSTRALEQAIRDGDLNNYENRFRTVDGQYRCISWHTTEEDGLVYAYGRDVTDQKAADQALAEAETALRQAQKMEAVGQLTGGIAHDFNNLLTGIIGSLDIVRRRVGEGRLEDLDRFIRAATTSADRAAALTQRLLAFSRRQTLAPTVVDPDQLIEGMMELIERTIGESITCKRLAMAAGWRTSCDANQLESAILNLALNARDAMPGGGLLKIETGRISLPADGDIQGQRVAAGDYVT
ncbi:MAG: PAS domain-containing protein, partial [Brevundimonas sp.]|nr:PAS domain-containing protein [Brevundimonas sp.]